MTTQRLLNCGIIVGALVAVMVHEISPLASAVAAGFIVLCALASMVVRP
jgi:hypothetical protein